MEPTWNAKEYMYMASSEEVGSSSSQRLIETLSGQLWKIEPAKLSILLLNQHWVQQRKPPVFSIILPYGNGGGIATHGSIEGGDEQSKFEGRGRKGNFTTKNEILLQFSLSSKHKTKKRTTVGARKIRPIRLNRVKQSIK